MFEVSTSKTDSFVLSLYFQWGEKKKANKNKSKQHRWQGTKRRDWFVIVATDLAEEDLIRSTSSTINASQDIYFKPRSYAIS